MQGQKYIKFLWCVGLNKRSLFNNKHIAMTFIKRKQSPS